MPSYAQSPTSKTKPPARRLLLGDLDSVVPKDRSSGSRLDFQVEEMEIDLAPAVFSLVAPDVASEDQVRRLICANGLNGTTIVSVVVSVNDCLNKGLALRIVDDFKLARLA